MEGLKVRLEFLCEGLISNVMLITLRGTDKKYNVEGLIVRMKFLTFVSGFTTNMQNVGNNFLE